MRTSPYSGLSVLHIDALGIAHTGVIVGQSATGHMQYVHSDHPAAPPAAWHFKLATAIALKSLPVFGEG